MNETAIDIGMRKFAHGSIESKPEVFFLPGNRSLWNGLTPLPVVDLKKTVNY